MMYEELFLLPFAILFDFMAHMDAALPAVFGRRRFARIAP
jgi:hypothetical protein